MLNCIRPFDCTRSRDRTGMSLRTLVFETSASTNSAIRALNIVDFINMDCEDSIFSGL